MKAKTKTAPAAEEASAATPDHPAAADPRANTTDDQNRIDFNDPALTVDEAVERNLADAAKYAG